MTTATATPRTSLAVAGWLVAAGLGALWVALAPRWAPSGLLRGGPCLPGLTVVALELSAALRSPWPLLLPLAF